MVLLFYFDNGIMDTGKPLVSGFEVLRKNVYEKEEYRVGEAR